MVAVCLFVCFLQRRWLALQDLLSIKHTVKAWEYGIQFGLLLSRS